MFAICQLVHILLIKYNITVTHLLQNSSKCNAICDTV